MLGSVVLDVAIGMSFVYLLLSLIASVVQEILATYMQLRAANLERALRSLFSGESLPAASMSLVKSVYNHGLVRGLYRDPDKDMASEKNDLVTLPGRLFRWIGNNLRSFLRWLIGIRPGKAMDIVSDQMLLPAYIPSETFALTLIDLLNADKKAAADTVPAIIASLKDAKGSAAEAIRTLAIASGDDLKAFQTHLEFWYNSAMDRAAGWYKHYVQTILLGIGLALAIVFNVDSIKVARTLWSDRDVRQALVNAASDYKEKNPQPAPPQPASAVSQANPGKPKTGNPQPAPAVNQADAAQLKDKTSPSDPSADQDKLKAKLDDTVKAFHMVATESLLPVGWQQSQLHTLKMKLWDTGGWNPFNGDRLRYVSGYLAQPGDWIIFLGWCMTAMAISLGAPFWFDTLNRFMVVRGTVKPDEKSKKEKSKA